MPRIHGNRGVAYISTTGAGTAAAVVSLNAWSIDKATDTVEVTAFGDLNKQYVQGLPDVKGSIGGWLDTVDDTLFDASESTDGCKMYLYPDRTVPTLYHYGPAWLSASISVPATGAAGITGSFVANGAWGRKP